MTESLDGRVARSRSQALGDLLRRIAARHPDKRALFNRDVFIVDSLPKNPSGKILKRELRQRYQPA